MNPTIALENAILFAHNQAGNLDEPSKGLVLQSFIHGVRAVVRGVTESENVGRLQKVLISPKISKELVEFGWRDASGNHGELSGYTGKRSIEKTCLQLADLTRAPFRTYYSIAQKDGILALQKTYPQSGGLRGMASHSDALLINDTDIPHGGDLSPFLEALPDEVEEIGRRSLGIRKVFGDSHEGQISNLHGVLLSVFNIMNGKIATFHGCDDMDNIATVKFLLDVYSLLPKEFRENFHPIRIKSDGSIDYPIYTPNGW